MEIQQEVGTTGWKQTVQESDWKIWRDQSTTCIVVPLAKHYELNAKIMRGGKSIFLTEVFSVAKVLTSGTQIPSDVLLSTIGSQLRCACRCGRNVNLPRWSE